MRQLPQVIERCLDDVSLTVWLPQPFATPDPEPCSPQGTRVQEGSIVGGDVAFGCISERVERVGARHDGQHRGDVGDRSAHRPDHIPGEEIGIVPDRLTSPDVGLSPTSPHNDDGITIDP